VEVPHEVMLSCLAVIRLEGSVKAAKVREVLGVCLSSLVRITAGLTPEGFVAP